MSGRIRIRAGAFRAVLSLFAPGLLPGLLLALAAPLLSTAAHAATDTPKRGWDEPYVPGIWLDPDGCEHWVMDDGAEGYMTPRVMPNGRPVCHNPVVCGILPTDQFFATDKAGISAAGRQKLAMFFRDHPGETFLIEGHTDSRASDSYNQRLSERRAMTVADVARSAGASVASVRGFGETRPKKPNTTAANMAENRRVDIICLN